MRSFHYQGILFRDARSKSGLTQAELAKKVNVHSQFVSNWERGLCGVPEAELRSVIRVLKIPRHSLQVALELDALSIINLKINKAYPRNGTPPKGRKKSGPETAKSGHQRGQHVS